MDVILKLSWDQDEPGDATANRRRDRYRAIRHSIVRRGREGPLSLHAFTYAFLGSAKNVDLFLDADDREIRGELERLSATLRALETFERDGTALPDELAHLREPYLRLRRVMLRPSARDERRALAHLLMNGPATAAQLVTSLEMPSPSGAVRAMLALAPVVVGRGQTEEERFEIDTELLPLALFAVRERMGIDPLAVLEAKVGSVVER